MSVLMILFVVWAVVTTVLVVLAAYRSTLALHEDTQIFLDKEVDHDAEVEQENLDRRVHRLLPYIRVLSVISGVLILLIAGLSFYNGFNGK